MQIQWQVDDSLTFLFGIICGLAGMLCGLAVGIMLNISNLPSDNNEQG